MADTKYKVDDLGTTFLPVFNSLRRMGVRAQIRAGHTGGFLAKYTRPVSKGISDGSLELPYDRSQRLLEILVDFNVLVVTEVLMWEVRELVDVVVCILFPPRR
jgi:hypothetical protein